MTDDMSQIQFLNDFPNLEGILEGLDTIFSTHLATFPPAISFVHGKRTTVLTPQGEESKGLGTELYFYVDISLKISGTYQLLLLFILSFWFPIYRSIAKFVPPLGQY